MRSNKQVEQARCRVSGKQYFKTFLLTLLGAEAVLVGEQTASVDRFVV